MENKLLTFMSHQGLVIASRRANNQIIKMNKNGWMSIHFNTYSREGKYKGNIIPYHFVTILFEKVEKE